MSLLTPAVPIWIYMQSTSVARCTFKVATQNPIFDAFVAGAAFNTTVHAYRVVSRGQRKGLLASGVAYLRSIPTREALLHSIPISEVKDMKNDVLRALKASHSKKNFEPCLQVQS